MEFSESFEFGNSTFMKLESQANHAFKDGRKEHISDDKPLDIISESPTGDDRKPAFCTTISKSRLVRNATQISNDSTQRRKFRRSKSDSTLPSVPSIVKSGHGDNISEFFKTDFSRIGYDKDINDELQSSDKEAISYLRVSQIEAAFNKIENIIPEEIVREQEMQIELEEINFSFESPINNNKSQYTKISMDAKIMEDVLSEGCQHTDENYEATSLDKAIFSEDLKDFGETEDAEDAANDLWEQTLPLSSIALDINDKNVEEPQVGSHDVSSFLYLPQHNIEERNKIINNDLKTSHKIFHEYEKPEMNESATNVSLSCMSPNQLQFSQNLSTSTKSTHGYVKKLPNEFNADVKHKAYLEISHDLSTKMSTNIDDLKYMTSWNLPPSILKEYDRKGIKKMFDWQIQCLNNPKILSEHCNLVYSAPTSAGKTLVSEILLLKTVLERGKKVLVILPFISVVREKMFYLQDLLTAAGYRVEGFFGGYSPPGGFESINVAICTIEKANSIVNKLMELGKLDEIGTVIVDEVHLISDPGRGYILELLLAKILYMSRKYTLQIQVITMSATLSNVELLRDWLDAEFFITNFRPVALKEMIKIGDKIYDNNLSVLRAVTEPNPNLKEPFPSIANDSDHVAQLCIETVIEGCSVVVFCPSKDWCENLAVQLAGTIHALGKQGGEWGKRLRAQLNREAIDDVKKQLKDIPTGLDLVLEKTITYACAFHHAGLTTEERDIVESSFKAGALKIIVATSTLSSGVNLPARRVLIRSPLFGGKQMSSLTYRQMIGRAGRTGKDTLGESILICTESNARIGRELITDDLKPILSCLGMDNSTHLKRALLEVISSGVATSKEDIDNFVNCTLLRTQNRISQGTNGIKGDHEKQEDMETALDFLLEYEFVRLQTNEESKEQMYVATRLGMACLASSMPPTDGLILFAELQKSRRCFVLESELHAVYLVTPYSVCYQLQDIDWLFFLDLWENLTPAMKKVGDLVGVKESFLVKAMRGQTKLDYKLLQIHKRFYIALALQELVNETPINVVATKFKCSRGMLQGLQQMASTFAGIVSSFCSSLQWDTLNLIVSQFKERLYFGIHRDLIDLMRIQDLNQKKARSLFDAGITSLLDLANSDVSCVEKILYNALSFDSAKQHDNENATEAAQRNEARNFYITGKVGITVGEAAKILIEEARQFIQHEIGVGNIKWSQKIGVVRNSNAEENELHMSIDDYKMPAAEKFLQIKPVAREDILNLKSPKKCIENLIKDQDTESVKKSKDYKKTCLPAEVSKKMYTPQKDEVEKVRLKEKKAKPDCRNDEKQHFKESVDHIKPHQTSSVKAQENQNVKSNVKTSPQEIKKGLDTRREEPVERNKYSPCGDSEDRKKIDPSKLGNKEQKENKQSSNNILLAGDSTGNKIIGKCPKDSSTAKKNNPEKRKSCDDFAGETQASPTKISKTNQNFDPSKCDEEKPSTSKRAQRLLRAKQLSEIKKQEWAQRNDVKVDQNQSALHHCFAGENDAKDTKSKNITPMGKQFSNAQLKADTKPVIPQGIKQTIENVNDKLLSTPRSSRPVKNCENASDVASEKLPRRSPRNIISSTRIENNISSGKRKDTSNAKNTIQRNVEIGNENEEHLIVNGDNMNVDLNKTQEDEIPNSQQPQEDVYPNNANSPHSSRSLRSLRYTQRVQSPIVSKKLKHPNVEHPQERNSNHIKDQRKPIEHKTEEPHTSSCIELSDISMENSLMKNPMHLNASHILSCSKSDTNSSSFKSIDVIDICGDQRLFKGAFKEIMANKRVGFCLGVQRQSSKRKPLIGANLLLNQVNYAEKDKLSTHAYEFQIDDTNYLSGIAFSIFDNLVYYMNMQSEGSCKGLTGEIKGKYLLTLLRSSEHTLIIYDAKDQLKALRTLFKDLEDITVSVEDPKVANWLLQPDKMHNINSLAQQFAPECSALINLCGIGRGYSSYGLDSESAILAKVRCSIESCVTVHILKGQIENLERIGTGQLFKFFKELEMPLQIALCNMEHLGFPTNSEALHNTFQQIINVMKRLETKIYELHGSRFNLGSSSAVARVLGLHRKTNGRVSTSKQILEKIDTPISQMIIVYRKLSTALSKNIQPLLKGIKNERIYGSSITFTSTGRISMTEPNLQNVAKDFIVGIDSDKISISCRSAFYPSDPKRCLISSDFCQLEMRILAHLSQDSALLEVMNSETDIFVAVAARWYKISENCVTEQLRNGTKQICYGIVYGMGMRSLSEGLKCTEQEAKLVSEQFHAAYPGIRSYIDKIIKFARNNGYIETITGRRRYLENINSEESAIRSQAERQAVNSTIQGSAADIAKSAILRMEKNIIKYREKLGINPQLVRLVLHLHDELIFEVPEDKAKKIAKILSVTMENCVKLNVPLKVKLKVGNSWGELQEIKL